ncbi:MAG: carbohydrate-binding family 9-like protein [Caldilineaceae bacterium]
MNSALPTVAVPRVAPAWAAAADPLAWDWHAGALLPPFLLANGRAPAVWSTATRLAYDENALYVHFDCVDNDIWGTYTKRDEPIYDEEVVEIFIGPGAETPVDYYEFEVSPNGVLLDVKVHNPSGDRADMQLDFDWDCPALRWGARRDDAKQRWQAFYAIPWSSIGASGVLPTTWRANFYRIERPRTGTPNLAAGHRP